MKKFVLFIIVAALGFGGAYLFFSGKLDRAQKDLAAREAGWAAERADLQAQLESAKNRSRETTILVTPAIAPSASSDSAPEILSRLRTLQAGPDSPRNGRRVIHELEKLIELGPSALPAIQQFLAQGTDIRYAAARPLPNGRIAMNFNMPPTLRLGLLEITRQIGGDQATEVLAEIFKRSGSAAEIAYSAYALQELAPDKYRESALAAARDLLSRQSGSTSPDGKSEREYLFGVLAFYGDTSYVTTAQNQLVQPDGKLDKSAINYLQSILGEAALPLVQQTWQDSRIPPDQKEPLARVALTYAGANPQADQFYQAAINDATIPAKQRKNLIEDLNEAGFADPSHLTDADLPLIQKRIGLIEQLAPSALDKVNAAAFQEAYKDLINMRASLLHPADKPK
jgi:hypothetical protein